jgi:hypothetical protein
MIAGARPMDDRVEATLAALEARCAALGVAADWNGAVAETALERVLSIAPGTARHWRSEGRGPPYYRAGRIRYRLSDVAQWWESHYVDGIKRDKP